jgi:predicted regulator of Ras-like GTPase activity (Roadblock/LC7/MglB family)
MTMAKSTERLNVTDINPFLKGSLSLTNITDLVQFLAASYKSGMIHLTKHPEGIEGKIFFMAGTLTNVSTDTLSGLDALSEIFNWHEGEFQFNPDVTSIEKNVGFSVQHAIMSAAVLHDQRSTDAKKGSNSSANTTIDVTPEERSTEMTISERDSTTVMNDLLMIPGIDAVVVVGRDGFVIESAGNSSRVNIDELGAALAHASNAIEEMGSELKVNVFQDMFIEYGKAVIMCKPIGDAIAAVIAPDASKLGIIRHKSKKYFEELALLF